MRFVTKIGAVLLGLVAVADARAATLSIEPSVVPLGGSVVFHVTTERELLPSGGYGPEAPHSLFFTGPCFNIVNFSFSGPFGQTFEMPFPSAGWRNDQNPACTHFNVPNRVGHYVATLDYTRADGLGSNPHYRIDVPFTVVPVLLDLVVTPQRIPVGGTVTLSAELDPAEPATILGVACAGPGISEAEEEPTDDFSVSWPGPLFDTDCDSSQPGVYHAFIGTSVQNDTDAFWVYGDRDGDGLLDLDDNCPNDPNSGQEDADGDEQGDVCDPDDDGDGISDETDNCPDLANTPQANLDEDADGDACDPDLDGDGIANESDNCPNVANPEQQEACVADPNDTDGDAQPNLADNCPDAFNPGQQDPDGDGIGTACDPDIDGDGLDNDDEAAAGTDPFAADTLDENGITPLWAGTVIEPGGFIEDGETVGVVIDAEPDVNGVAILVYDPLGSPFLERTIDGLSPFAFAFTPILPGEWTIQAELGDGTILTEAVHVIPEPDSVAAAITAILVLGLVARRASAPGTA